MGRNTPRRRQRSRERGGVRTNGESAGAPTEHTPRITTHTAPGGGRVGPGMGSAGSGVSSRVTTLDAWSPRTGPAASALAARINESGQSFMAGFECKPLANRKVFVSVRRAFPRE